MSRPEIDLSSPPYDDGGDEGDCDEQHGAYHNEEDVEQVVLEPEAGVDNDQRRVITTFVGRGGDAAPPGSRGLQAKQ